MIKEFTNTIIAIKQFEEKNKEVFKEYKELLELKANQEIELKEWSKQNGDIENGIVKVTKVRKWKKWLDWSGFSTKSKKIIKESGGLIEKEPEVDRKIVEELAKDGKISREEIAKCFNEEEMSPSIIIKII